MTSAKKRQLLASLGDLASQADFVEEHINTGLSFQIRALRKARGWSQEELGRRARMAQETISQLESPDYGRFTLRTLKRLAMAFHVGLVVKFAPMSEIVNWELNLSPEALAPPPSESDPGLRIPEPIPAQTVGTTVQLPAHQTGRMPPSDRPATWPSGWIRELPVSTAEGSFDALDTIPSLTAVPYG